MVADTKKPADYAVQRLAKVAGHMRTNSLTMNTHDLNPAYFLPRSAAIQPDALAIVQKGSDNVRYELTYGQFADRARGLAYYVEANGYKSVSILMSNTPAFLVSVFGIAATHAIHAGHNYRLKPQEIHYTINLAQADLIIVDEELYPLIKDFVPDNGRTVDVLIDRDVSDFDKCGSFAEAVKTGWEIDAKTGSRGWDGLFAQGLPEDSTISLWFTSGTTGYPKAVEYSHRSVYLMSLSNIIESNINCESALGEDKCGYLWILPMFHASGWTFPYSVTACRGVHFCLRKIDYSEIWWLLDNYHITHFNAAPTVNTLICNHEGAHKLRSPVRVTVAASPPSAALFKQMISMNLLPVHTYGLTETYGPFTKCYVDPKWKDLPDDKFYEMLARQGQGFIASLEARVVDPDTMKDVKRNGEEIGEIVVRGNAVMKGYFRDRAATEKAFEGGYFKTGDLAVMHPDGFIKIVDRGKDIIISGGENISSVGVENEIVKHPAVLEAAVVAVPDEKYGERPKAFITLRSSAKLAPAELIAWLKERIGGFQVPKEVTIVNELPKTSTGKIRKNVLRDVAKGKAKLPSS
ncbi:hypothetical protein CANCADRAFT_30965 [Tortispora caseinolytica NRRL Y-17796]|uniref:AMP-dependent synthetase/ligase domain-containing protein n=1 Tax=Tortispora caseinolytica NRRL Y-17796 TaxID=767744 RepID=A0A1E4TMI3_9ASCO|nr:hypothetical protein CANCADRAFT_30965 [Tortispora caseinolytica NRRL Y-17796]